MTACPSGQGDGLEIHWALPTGVQIPLLSLFAECPTNRHVDWHHTLIQPGSRTTHMQKTAQPLKMCVCLACRRIRNHRVDWHQALTQPGSPTTNMHKQRGHHRRSVFAWHVDASFAFPPPSGLKGAGPSSTSCQMFVAGLRPKIV